MGSGKQTGRFGQDLLTGGVSGYPILLRDSYSNGTLYVLTIPDDFGDLYQYPAGALNTIRHMMSKDCGLYIEGPSKVSLFPYDNKTFVVENFNDEPVDINIVVNNNIGNIENLQTGEKLKPTAVQVGEKAWARIPQYTKDQTVFKMKLMPHSYKAFKY